MSFARITSLSPDLLDRLKHQIFIKFQHLNSEPRIICANFSIIEFLSVLVVITCVPAQIVPEMPIARENSTAESFHETNFNMILVAKRNLQKSIIWFLLPTYSSMTALGIEPKIQSKISWLLLFISMTEIVATVLSYFCPDAATKLSKTFKGRNLLWF